MLFNLKMLMTAKFVLECVLKTCWTKVLKKETFKFLSQTLVDTVPLKSNLKDFKIVNRMELNLFI